MTEPDLNFITRQLDRLINEVGTLRDEVRVLSAIVMRLDTGQSAVLAEQRATRDQLAINEDPQTPPLYTLRAIVAVTDPEALAAEAKDMWADDPEARDVRAHIEAGGGDVVLDDLQSVWIILDEDMPPGTTALCFQVHSVNTDDPDDAWIKLRIHGSE